MRGIGKAVLVTLLVVGLFGCSSMSRKERGAVIGGATGAVAGAVIGKQAGNTAAGAIIGAAVGGVAGAVIGDYMDKQAAELEDDLAGARVERIGEGIKITFGSGILFDVDQYDLRSASQSDLTRLATILNKYPDTDILVEGHTDADGTDEHNQTLSERRAKAVAAFLFGQNVSSRRMASVGYGETQPIAGNDTAEGKQANRRVEIAIMANEELKKAAEEQAAQG